MQRILIVNGPNLNMLGSREANFYGKETLKTIEEKCQKLAKLNKIECEFFQDNGEGAIVGKIQQAKNHYNAVIINAGAYTHTSVAIRDALILTGLPVIEIHISNIFSREEFRHKSYISDIAKAVICGCGTYGYELALLAAKKII